jgi:hypothetical protein
VTASRYRLGVVVEVGEVPERCSVALAIQVIRETFRRWWECPDETFVSKLQGAIKDDHARHRSKKARYRPDYKDKPAAGKPVIRLATAWHKARLHPCVRTAA